MRSKEKIKLSVVIPVFNEAARLPQALAVCRQHPEWEFIFVNDGSIDATEKLIQSAGYKIITYPKNRGKGFALKQGVAAATQPLVLITDVDWSTPLSELPKLLSVKTDIIIGSRKMTGANITRHQPVLREWLGKQFTGLTNFWLGLKVTDVTCGFKLFKTTTAKKLFALSRINRWGYDAEILYLAGKNNFTVKEVPVVWHNDAGTKVNLAKDIIRSLLDLLLIRLYHG